MIIISKKKISRDVHPVTDIRSHHRTASYYTTIKYSNVGTYYDLVSDINQIYCSKGKYYFQLKYVSY